MLKIRDRNVVVNLTRMSDMEYKFYVNSDKIITKNFDIKIARGMMTIGNESQYSKNGSFNVTLKERESKVDIKFDEQNLERDPKPVNAVNAANIKTPQSAAISKCVVSTLNSLINGAWKVCKMSFRAANTPIREDDLVLAKMKSYSPWPARVDGFSKNKKRMNVYFYGTNNTGIVDAVEVVKFEQCHDVIKLLLLRKISEFHKAVREIESILGIRPELSLLKELQQLN